MSGDEEPAGCPTAPPSFGHPEPETPAKATVPGGFRPPPGPPAAPWWAPTAPDQPLVAAEPLPGVLVAGPGVPVVDTRRAVPREPLVRQVPLVETTDPDGFPAITSDTVVDLVRPQGSPPSPTLVDAVLLSWQPLEAERPQPLPEDAPALETPITQASQATAAPAPAAEAPGDEQADSQQLAAEEIWQPLETEQRPAAITAAVPVVGPEPGEELPQEPIAEKPPLAATAASSMQAPGHEIPQEPIAGQTWQPLTAAATAPSADQEIDTAAWPIPGQTADQKPGAGETWQPAASGVEQKTPQGQSTTWQPTAAPSREQEAGPGQKTPGAGETWQPAAAGTDQKTETRTTPGQKSPGAGETWQPAPAAKAEPVEPAVPVVPTFDAPVLVPVAILPPPAVTLVKPTPEQQIAAKTVLAVLTPVLQEHEQPLPPTPAQAVSTPVRAPRRPRSKQPAWLAVFVLVPAMVAGFAGYLIASGSDSAKKQQPVAASQPTTPAAATTPTATASPSASAAASPSVTGSLPAGPSVDSDKTDPEPLTIREIFPVRRIPLSNTTFVQDYKSLNKRCDYAASGAMAAALLRANCQGVVRSTFVTRNKKIGVTTGVVAMPTKLAAVRTSEAGDPAHLEWFRVMPGKRTQALLNGGGHAASTTYGRYIIYAYVQYLDGTTATPDDPALTQVAKDFIGYLNEPLKAR